MSNRISAKSSDSKESKRQDKATESGAARKSGSGTDPLLDLQRSIGNQEVQALFKSGQLQGHMMRFSEELTPEEYINNHTNLFGMNLQEENLASDLYLLAWQSSKHYEFILKVFKLLDKENRVEVAELFFKQIVSDNPIEDIAMKGEGRSFLTIVVNYLPANNNQRFRVEKIISEGPQNESESERLGSIEALKKKGGNIDVVFYPEYAGMDSEEVELKKIAQKREKLNKTNISIPMQSFLDIKEYLDVIAQQLKAADFVRELHLMGHGTKNNFGFGEYYYSTEYLESYETGLFEQYMSNSGTIYLEGCAVAKGSEGKAYLREIGRIFFGKKSGFLKGNTCFIFAIGELTECQPRTLHWPSDFTEE